MRHTRLLALKAAATLGFWRCVAGAAGLDFVLLVVTADDGPMTQIREHPQIVDLLGVGQGP